MNERNEYTIEPEIVENEEKETAKNFKFTQILSDKELKDFNCYLLKQRGSSMILSRVVGLVALIYGIVELTSPDRNLVISILMIVFGLFGLFAFVPIIMAINKAKIMKAEFKESIRIDIEVNDEGILYDIKENNVARADEEYQSEAEVETEVYDESPFEKETSNDEFREMVREENDEASEQEETVHDAIYDTEPQPDSVATIDGSNNYSETTEAPLYPFPWGAMSKVVDTGEYIYVHLVRYMTLIIRPSDCSNPEELVEYMKEKLGTFYKDKKRK